MELENKPGTSALRQQQLKGWNFKFSLRAKGILYLIIGILFILMGTIIITTSNSVIEHKKRYDNLPGYEAGKNKICKVDIDVMDHMDSKVFFYYEIENMYQNHRLYAKSLNVKQLQGEDLSKSENESSSNPVLHVKDLVYPFNTGLDKNMVANPCGLVARSYFHDEFRIASESSGKKIEFDETGISFYIDRDKKFKNRPMWT